MFQFWSNVQRFSRQLCCSYKPMGKSDSELYLAEVLAMGYVVSLDEVHEELEKLRLRQGL